MRYFVFLFVVGIAAQCAAADWITAPGEFTHDPRTGKPVQQYTPIGPVYAPNVRADYTTSGYRHTRDSLQIGRTIDHLHLVEEWGNPVRPYGEWRYPYRPYSVPYSQWGAPFAGLGGGGYGGWGPWGGGVGPGPGWGGNNGGIPPAWQTPPQVPNNPGLGWPGPGGVYPYSDEHYPLNRGSWDLPPSSGIGGT